MTRGTRILGIDPGLTGALAFLHTDSGAVEELEDMPRLGKIVNAALLPRLIEGYGPVLTAVVEQAQIMPRVGAGAERSRGTAGAFNYGVNYGIIVGTLATLEIRTVYVSPSVWKRKAGLTSDKTLSRRRASERWPARADDFKRVKDDGRAEAALLAAWWMSENGDQLRRSKKPPPLALH